MVPNNLRFVSIILLNESYCLSTSSTNIVASLLSVSLVSSFRNLKLSSLNSRQLSPKKSSENIFELEMCCIILGILYDNVSLVILLTPLVKKLTLKLVASSCSSLLSSNNITNIE